MKALIRYCAILLLAAATGFANAQAAVKPVPAKPAPAKPKPKAVAKQAAKPAPEEENPGVQAVEKIFDCVAAGLPEGWQRAWVVVTELAADGKERSFEGRFHYSLDPAGANPVDLVPCNAREVAEGVYALNEFLEREKRAWKVATLVFTRDGKFELKYDYTP